MSINANPVYTNLGLLVWSGTGQLASRVIPSFTLYPVNNDRTAWQDFGYPLVLTIPGRRTPNGLEITGTQPVSLTIRVLNAPDRPFVNGHDHVGQRWPEEILYTKTIGLPELLTYQIDTAPQNYYDKNNVLLDRTPVDGDKMLLTLESGVSDYIVWFQDTDYYDLSGLLLPTDNLPNGYYLLEYTVNYQHRILTRDANNVVCITDDIVPSTCTIPFNHPGDMIADMISGLPGVNLQGQDLKSEPMVKLFRPLSDALQDIFDEQWFLQSVNWVRDIQFPLVPYLVPTLGWDIPFFPRSADDLRKAVLLSLVEIQKTRGSLTAINRLFNLFGFTILVNNLYFMPGTATYTANDVVGPNEYEGFDLVTDGVVDPLLVAQKTPGFGAVVVPLVYRPQGIDGIDPFKSNRDSGSVTIHSYCVKTGSAAEAALVNYLSASGSIGPVTGSINSVNASGFETTADLITIEAMSSDDGLVEYNIMRLANGFVAQALVSGSGGPVSVTNATMDIEKNTVSISYDKYYDFADDISIYSVAIYDRIKVLLPTELTDNRSNYFDVQILSKISNALPTDASVLSFLLDFIYRVKAAHSLLRAFRYLSTFEEVYNVTDFCVGYDVPQRYNVDAGVQQVPPAVMPSFPTGSCIDNPTELVGFKPEDYAYRQTVLTGSQLEYEAYAALAGRASTGSNTLKLPSTVPDSCGYIQYGQNIVLKDSRTDEFDLVVIPGIGANSLNTGSFPANIEPPNADDRINVVVVGKNDSLDKMLIAEAMKYTSTYQFICAPSTTQDWCFKGRVDDEVSVTYHQASMEQYDLGVMSCRTATLGSGAFWMFNSPSDKFKFTGMNLVIDVRNAVTRNLTFSGGKLHYGEQLVRDFGGKSGWLGRILAGLDKNTILCFSNRPNLDDIRPESTLALTPQSLNITVPHLHFPTCRFVTMRNLLSQFTSSHYRMRPWDQSGCVDDKFLNPEIVSLSDGGEALVFDDMPFTVAGNGLAPDVPDMNNDASGIASVGDIWHSIYSYGVGRSYDDLDVTYTSNQFIDTNEPLFDTAVYDSSSGLFHDNIDGYPSASGAYSYSSYSPDTSRDVSYASLGLPIYTPIMTSGLWRLGSGIHITNHDGTDGTWNTSAASRRPYGVRLNCEVDEDEYGGESVALESILDLHETIGSPYKMDGSIPNMLNIGVIPKL